jgi:hypothetical protein|tara:strand:- start:737 stop:970 length:234 start_codon:yes stop_codon:yes gene_type:complete
MAKKKFTPPDSETPKTLKVGNVVITNFLGVDHKCSVTEVISKDTYKLLSTTGTIFGKAKWGKHLIEYSPWYIVKKTK